MKYFSDVVASGIDFILLSSLPVILAIWIKYDSTGPVFHRRIRVGRNSRDLRSLKSRSMRVGFDKGGFITVGGRDPRITWPGYYIRKYKLGEFPQLINVLKGDMSLVGPRPEVYKYVDMYMTEQRRVLAVRPGITDYASTVCMDENGLSGQSSSPDKTYVEDIMPAKIELNMRYANHPILFEYFKSIFLTIFKIAR